MRSRVLSLSLAPLLLAALAASADAESVATLGNGQRVAGTVPTGEVIRLSFPVPEGAEPRLSFTLKGSAIPISFNRSDIYDPDGNLIPDTSRFFEGTRVRRNRSTLKLRDFVAPKSGTYQLVIETNSGRLPGINELRVSGKLRVQRETRITAELDEARLSLDVGLLVGDLARVKVKRRTGGIPTITGFVTPQGAQRPPPQKQTKTGAKTEWRLATRDAVHTFEFGYRPGSTEGDFTASVSIRPSSTNGTAVMRLANAPGVPISVRPVDRATTLNYGVGAPQLAYDGTVFLVAALRSGAGADVAARFFDRDLFGTPGTPTPVVLAGPADVGPVESIGGHRLLFVDNRFVLGFWTSSGTSAWLATYDRNFLSDNGLARKTGLKVVTSSASTAIRDPFLTTNGTRLSFGLWVAPSGHDVHIFESDLSDVGVVSIGGGALGHAAGAGVAWHDDDSYFDFWAPDTLVPTLPSDLHRQRYSALWQAQAQDSKPVADAGVVETMPTAVVYDPGTGATIVHYVVPENDVTGDGVVHRVVFDSAGDEVPGSHVALEGKARNRPTAVLVGSSLYLGTSSPAGPLIERYPLLR